jgi:uncharacterized membrane protein
MARWLDDSVVLRVLINVLCLAGLANALYFTFAYYGRIKKARWVPEILCAQEGSTCVRVVQTPYARLFGVPNSLLGIVYYMLVMAWTMQSRTAAIKLRFHPFAHVISVGMALLILVSMGTMVFGSYLIYALRRKLHVDCLLCYTAHAINTAVFVLLVILAF